MNDKAASFKIENEDIEDSFYLLRLIINNNSTNSPEIHHRLALGTVAMKVLENTISLSTNINNSAGNCFPCHTLWK